MAEHTKGEKCDECGIEAPMFEVAGKQLCALCIAPPPGAYQNGVAFEGTRVFVVVDDKAFEIKE